MTETRRQEVEVLQKAILTGIRADLNKREPLYTYEWRDPDQFPYTWELGVKHPRWTTGIWLWIDGDEVIVGRRQKAAFDLNNPKVFEQLHQFIREYYAKRV